MSAAHGAVQSIFFQIHKTYAFLFLIIYILTYADKKVNCISESGNVNFGNYFRFPLYFFQRRWYNNYRYNKQRNECKIFCDKLNEYMEKFECIGGGGS